MQTRQEHQQEVQGFLRRNVSDHPWELTLPQGSGNETYVAQSNGHAYFIKLNAAVATYQAVASIGLTPPVLFSGSMADGTAILVQPYVAGKSPSRKDYRLHLEKFASAIRLVHQCAEVKQILPAVSSDLYRTATLSALDRLQKKWEQHKSQVPAVAGFVDESLAKLRQQANAFQGAGLVASHNDLCNANWLLSTTGELFLIDLDSMALDDPAVDLGATLWWYYPPALRDHFLTEAGYANTADFAARRQVRMAMHCLSIRLPREGSFDEFDPATFDESLTDFRAILAGKDNPQGYAD